MNPYIEIAGRKIGYDYEPLVIAEIGINHEGSLKTAKEMVDEAFEMGFSAEIFDLRVIRPLNIQKIFDSVAITGKLITVDTGFQKFGIGAEIVSEVVSNCFSELKAAPVRIGMPEHPSPSSRGFLPGLYPDAIRIVTESARMLGITSDQLAKAVHSLKDKRGDLSIDVPDPRFKGPF